MEVMERRGRRSEQLLDDLKEKEETGKGKRKHWEALWRELASKEAIELS
jgi:hypothetical protein